VRACVLFVSRANSCRWEEIFVLIFFFLALSRSHARRFTRDSCGSKTPQKNERENGREGNEKSTPSRFVFVRFRAAENERLKIFFFFLDLIVDL